jgi:adenosylmethionine-8-amino-7-oxononanoate aminotransferase
MLSSSLTERDRKAIWHPYTQAKIAPPPLPIVYADGVYLYTENGERILDGISSWWVNIHGHNHPRLNEALANQARKVDHVLFAGCTHRPGVELAERLLAILPSGLTRIFYSDNGSTAVEVALKMAYQYWRNLGQRHRRTFITLHHAYHGDTLGAMSASEDSIFTRPFASLLFEVKRADAPYCYRCPLGLQRDACQIDCLGNLEHLLQESGDTVAAVVVEPMLQGAGGMLVWPAEFLAGVRRLCDEHGTLMIADEVLTGFGRTGKMFACEHAAVSPDIVCLSKALTAGYLPLGVTSATESIYAAFLSDDRSNTFFHGHSYTANPLACSVALASLDLFEEFPVLQRVQALESLMKKRLEPLESLPHIGEVRVLGGVGIVELVEDKVTKAAGGYLDGLGPQLSSEFLKRGLLLRPLGNVLYFMPPYVITGEETEWALDQIIEVLQAWPPTDHNLPMVDTAIAGND